MKLRDSATYKGLRGFTLFEIMVVVAVLGIILGILIPNITNIKSRSRDEEIAADVDAISLALEDYKRICKTYPDEWLSTTKNIQYGSSGRVCSKTLGEVLPKLKKIKDLFDGQVQYVGLSYSGSRGNCSQYRLAYPMASQDSSPILRQKNSPIKSNRTMVDCKTGGSVQPLGSNYYIRESR
jgi:prepilin-type N-terminal cleavage/methylation domain-containing protein